MVKPDNQAMRELARSVLTLYSLSTDFEELEVKAVDEQDTPEYITHDEINKLVLHSQLSLKGFLTSVGESFQANVNADIFHGIMLSTLPPKPKSVFSSITLHMVCVDEFGEQIAAASATLNLTISVQETTNIYDDNSTDLSYHRTLTAELS